MTTQLSKGANAPLDGTPPYTVRLTASGGPALDVSALLTLETTAKVESDADFVFYNQKNHESGAVEHRSGADGDSIVFDPARTPDKYARVVVTASAEDRPFSGVSGLRLSVTDGAGTEVVSFAPGDLGPETALNVGEFYRRNGAWKFRAVAQGWDTGLAGLATDFGISVEEPSEPAPPAATSTPPPPPSASAPATMPPPPPSYAASTSTPPNPPVSLAKTRIRLEKVEQRTNPADPAAQGVVSLAKSYAVSLEKKGLADHTARVAICLDISASMSRLYSTGQVQQVAEQLLALGLLFDDNAAIDVYAFGKNGHRLGEMTLDNLHEVLAKPSRRRPTGLPKLEYATNYATAMELLRTDYFGGAGYGTQPRPAQLPVYCMFLTDGAATDPRRAEQQVVASSYEPIFWQFVGIGRGGFDLLEKLDDLGGRFLDNADFLPVRDPAEITFDSLMAEYPGWLARARERGLLG